MKIKDVPRWIGEFLTEKAPWWLEGSDDYLDVVEIDERNRTARVRKGEFIYMLDPRNNVIR